ncbi:MAG: hypothetical protein ACI3Y5_00535 [Prevotella sp.]
MNRKNILCVMLLAMLAWLSPLSLRAGKNVILKSPEEYQVMNMSPNGLWACGVYVDYSDSYYGFRWNLISGEVELLSSATQSEAWSISDDGVVAGCYETSVGGTAKQSYPAYYADGEWHIVEFPEGKVGGGIAYDITPDGHYMSGSLVVNGRYDGYIWKDGKIYRTLENTRTAMPYCISPDGQAAGGWIDTGNRQACYWQPDGKVTFLSTMKSPWSSARTFSPDGKKLLFWGGWNAETEDVQKLLAVYDVTTGEKTWLEPVNKDSSFELFDIANDGTIVGTNNDRGYIYTNGERYYIDDYLTQRGVDLKELDAYMEDGTDFYQIIRGMSLSADASVMCILYYANSGEAQAALRSAIIKFDYDVRDTAPSSFRASQLSDINAAKLTWGGPVGADGITGYNIYRDGEKIATTEAATTIYCDTNLENKSYSYEVSVVYADRESARTNALSVTIEPNKTQAPQALFSRQKGYNNAFVTWAEPKSNLITKEYADFNTANVNGFGPGGDDVEFEGAIRYGAEEMAAYKGCTVSKIKFCPLSEQKDWTLNLYTYEGTTLKLLYSQPITQQLESGRMNTIVLDTPQPLPAGELVAAVSVRVPKASNNVFGIDFGNADVQYSDLLRLKTDADFYSLSEMYQAQGYMYRATWLMSVILSPEGASADVDDIKEYTVYADGVQVSSTTATDAIIPSLSEGSHTIGVNAVYADGKQSEPATISQDIKNDIAALPAVNNVSVSFENTTDMTATWQRPADKEKKLVTYSGETPSDLSVVVPDGYNDILLGCDYPASMLKGYKGYAITSCRFYPVAVALFTVLIYKDGELVAEQPYDIEEGDVNRWHTVTLDTPIDIQDGSSYRVVIDCYDVSSGMSVIAVDTNAPYSGYSDLYSLDGQSYSYYTADTGIQHNLMIGMTIEDKQTMELPVLGYDVSVDGKKLNTAMLAEPRFTYTFPSADKDRHALNVDVYYEAVPESVKGSDVYFIIGSSTGIEENTIASVSIRKTDSYITVTGDNVSGVSLFSADGAAVAATGSDTLAIGQLSEGVYVVKAVVDGKTVTRKIRIVR